MAQLDQINARVQGSLYSGGGISNVEANAIVSMFGSVTDQLNASTMQPGQFNPYFRNAFRTNPYNRRLYGQRNYGWF